MQSAEKMKIDELDRQVRTLLIKVTIGLLAFISLSMLGGMIVLYIQRANEATTLAQSVNKDLLVGDYREAIVNLNQSIGSQFNQISYHDRDSRHVFTVGDSSKSLLRGLEIEREIRLSNAGEKTGHLSFHYDSTSTVINLLAIWLAILVLNFPLIWFAIRRIRDFIDRQYRFQTLARIGEISRQVAHDIRSPLSAIKVSAANVDFGNVGKRSLFESSVQRIEQIASDVLAMGKGEIKRETSDAGAQALGTHSRTELDVVDVLTVVREFVEGKKVELHHNGRIHFKDFIDSEMGQYLAVGDPEGLTRILSNLVNNSIESIKDTGWVSLTLSKDTDEILIEIRDSGCGIPDAVLSQIGIEGFTWGKPSGNGLGLHHAMKLLRQWGGRVSVHSKNGMGTTVTLYLREQIKVDF